MLLFEGKAHGNLYASGYIIIMLTCSQAGAEAPLTTHNPNARLYASKHKAYPNNKAIRSRGDSYIYIYIFICWVIIRLFAVKFTQITVDRFFKIFQGPIHPS